MKRTAARPLPWLGALLAVYLCAPFVASIPQVGAADWHGVDWKSTLSAAAVSAGSASVASLVILLGGVPLGYLLARSNSRKAALLGFIVQLPLALPPLTSGVLLLFLLGPYSWVGQLTGGALTDSFTGIVLAETFVAAPFLIIAARSAFSAVDPMFEDVAATLGHRAGSRFFRVTLPVAWPAISAGLALAWLRAFGEFGATVMVAYHPYSLPVYTYVVFGGQGLPAMMPLLLPTLAIAIACAALSIYSRRGRPSLNSELVNGDDADTPTLARPLMDEDDRRLSIVLKKHLGSFDLDIEWAPSTRRLAIIGTSGSGKSLTLRLIAGLEAGQTASVMLGGSPLGALPPEERRIGYMPQDYGLFPHMTVAQQLAFPLNADAASARQWVEQLGISTLLQRLPRELSFGQRQRVALARALTQHSQLLLFDEPFAALDTPRRRRLQQSLRALQREISAVTVIVTHDPDEAALLADEVLLIEHGRVLQAGPVSDVFERPASMRVAELLGLHNVGQGRLIEANKIELGAELRLDIAGNTAIPVGQTVMWRLPGLAIMPSDEGAFQGTVEGIELRRGDRYARLKVCGVTFDIPSEDTRLKTGTSHRFSVDIGKLTIWSI
ncbi:ABC transporter ATP-binding protein/permease [Caballeronia sordidicola]|uniref:Molybdenum transport ATP-binding protein ModC / Molybdenum transport system permease protein ModB n=1 Tax=Caballeronia sordidicola TaxID=196367 RepID=A0A226WU12_CABSO|nr:ATP-binding cassette domain-containing protein [Caballeronia sordidicola]OXC74319.1 Molybdenum transport ATP-binding protein ModC / Molybdenum transport system permease protein ModB [Caballeronia sordidicola]